MSWQSIETAPKDGKTIILGAVGDFQIYLCRWVEDKSLAEGGLWIENGFNDPLVGVIPTHWMPVPEPPSGRALESVGAEQVWFQP